MDKTTSQIQSFEKDLDVALESLKSLEYDGEKCILKAAQVMEVCYAEQNYSAAEHLSRGLNILAPFFIKSDKHNKIAHDILLEDLIKDLNFAGHYYLIREYLYYTYNSKGSILWNFKDDGIDIRFGDATMPRQFFIAANNYYVDSMDTFSNFNLNDEIINLVRGEDEFTVSPQNINAMELIEKEVELKLTGYYNFLKPDDEIDLGGYNYYQFYKVYQLLLVKAIYHRYHSRANNSIGPLAIPFDGFIADLVSDTGFTKELCLTIIDEISYSLYKEKEKIQTLYFSLYHLRLSNVLIMIPHHFALWEGFVNLLRIVAVRRPRLFLEKVSGILSKRFVDYIADMFSKQGFSCLKDIKLSRFDKRLPDIDLLIISEEPALGYVMFFCEIKNPVPPRWSKDQLRVLGKDSLSKAFDQISLIQKFLNSATGLHYLKEELIPKDKPIYFQDGFSVLANFLIITSHNAGMFFGDKKCAIIDYRTLRRILKRCDGDMEFVLETLSNLKNWTNECLKIIEIQCNVGSKCVTYEAIAIGQLLDFQPTVYKSEGIDKKLLQEYLEGIRGSF